MGKICSSKKNVGEDWSKPLICCNITRIVGCRQVSVDLTEQRTCGLFSYYKAVNSESTEQTEANSKCAKYFRIQICQAIESELIAVSSEKPNRSELCTAVVISCMHMHAHVRWPLK